MNSIDNLIQMRLSTVLGFQHYVSMMRQCHQRDAAVMSVRCGAHHSRNPEHYKVRLYLNNGRRYSRDELIELLKGAGE